MRLVRSVEVVGQIDMIGKLVSEQNSNNVCLLGQNSNHSAELELANILDVKFADNNRFHRFQVGWLATRKCRDPGTDQTASTCE